MKLFYEVMPEISRDDIKYAFLPCETMNGKRHIILVATNIV